MARVLVTFATRKRLTSFVGRPDCLRRQAHPAQPSTPCIRLSRLWRSFTTSRMKRVGKCAEESAAFDYQEFWIIRNLKTLRMATFPHPQCLRA